MLTRPVAGLGVLLLALTGCAGIEKEQAAPLPASSSTPETATATPDGAPAVTESGNSSTGCGLAGRYLGYELIHVNERATLTGVELDGEGIVPGRAWTSPKPPSEVPGGGMLRWEGPGSIEQHTRKATGWDQRRRVGGAVLEPGDHYVFVRYDAPEDAHLRMVRIGWKSGETHGEARLRDRIQFGAGCGQPGREGLVQEEGWAVQSCRPDPGRVLLQLPFEAAGRVTIEDVGVYPGLVPVRGAWVTPAGGAVPDLVAAVDWPAGFGPEDQATYRWDERQQAVGAQLRKGAYHLFVIADLAEQDVVDGLDIAWLTDKATGTLELHSRVTVGDCEE